MSLFFGFNWVVVLRFATENIWPTMFSVKVLSSTSSSRHLCCVNLNKSVPNLYKIKHFGGQRGPMPLVLKEWMVRELRHWTVNADLVYQWMSHQAQTQQKAGPLRAVWTMLEKTSQGLYHVPWNTHKCIRTHVLQLFILQLHVSLK